MTTGSILPDQLRTMLSTVRIENGGRRATIGEEEPLEASSPVELRGPLAAQLYELLHTGPRADTGEGVPRSWRDRRLESQLAAATPHPTTLRHTELARVARRDGLVAMVDGVRFVIDEEHLEDGLPPEVRDGEVTQWSGRIRLPSARPGLSPGFFLVDGSLGRVAGDTVLRLYLHVTAAADAPAVWQRVLSYLEEHRACYRAKIGSHESLYPRRDAMVVYLGRTSWQLLDGLVELAGSLPGLGAQTSALAHRLAPGVGLAFEPEDSRPGWTSFSFGEHRSHAIADAVLSHGEHGDISGVEAAAEIAAALREAGADPNEPWRNGDSPDLAAIRGAVA